MTRMKFYSVIALIIGTSFVLQANNQTVLENYITLIMQKLKNDLITNNFFKIAEPINDESGTVSEGESVTSEAEDEVQDEIWNPTTLERNHLKSSEQLISFFKKDLTTILNTIPLPQSLKYKEAFIKPTLNRILSTAAVEIFIHGETILDWYPHLPLQTGIAFVLTVIEDVKNRYKKPQPLTYTSVSSGSLLIDYLIVQELKAHGFTSLTINLIGSTHVSYFKHKVGAHEIQPKGKPGITVITYDQAADYIEKTKESRQKVKRTDILILIDPSRHLFTQTLYPNQANAVLISGIIPGQPKEENLFLQPNVPGFFIYMPKQEQMQVITNNKTVLSHSADAVVMYLYNLLYVQLNNIIKQTTPAGNATPEFIKELVALSNVSKNLMALTWYEDLYLTLQSLLLHSLANPRQSLAYILDRSNPILLPHYKGQPSDQAVYKRVDPLTFKNIAKKRADFEFTLEKGQEDSFKNVTKIIGKELLPAPTPAAPRARL